MLTRIALILKQPKLSLQLAHLLCDRNIPPFPDVAVSIIHILACEVPPAGIFMSGGCCNNRLTTTVA